MTDTCGLGLVTSTKRADGSGLKVLLWTSSFGGRESRTTLEQNAAFTTTMVQRRNGMTGFRSVCASYITRPKQQAEFHMSDLS